MLPPHCSAPPPPSAARDGQERSEPQPERTMWISGTGVSTHNDTVDGNIQGIEAQTELFLRAKAEDVCV